MPATSLYQLFAFEDQFSVAAGSVLAAGGFPNAFDRGNSGAIGDTATLVKFTRGAAVDGAVGLIPRGPYAGRSEFVQFTGTLEIQRTRPRKSNTTVAMDPGVQRELGRDMGKISALFLRAVLPFSTANLPYLDVSEIHPQPADWGVDEENQLDGCTLTWQVTFAIRKDAWPES